MATVDSVYVSPATGFRKDRLRQHGNGCEACEKTTMSTHATARTVSYGVQAIRPRESTPTHEIPPTFKRMGVCGVSSVVRLISTLNFDHLVCILSSLLPLSSLWLGFNPPYIAHLTSVAKRVAWTETAPENLPSPPRPILLLLKRPKLSLPNPKL